MVQDNDYSDDRNPSQGDDSPFSADLGGDFGNSFGGDSGSSPGFKEGGSKTRLIVLLCIFFGLLGVAGYFYFYEDDGFDDDDFSIVGEHAGEENKKAAGKEELADEGAALPNKAKGIGIGKDKASATQPEDLGMDAGIGGEAGEGAKSEFLVEGDQGEPSLESADSVSSSSGGSTGASFSAPTLLSPADGYSRIYDETSVAAEFKWEGGGGSLLFARDSGMSSVKLRRQVLGSSAKVRKLYPGTWYWQVRNSAGSSEVRSFHVQQAQQRALSLSQPGPGGFLSGNGGVVAWTGDTKVSYYRVELSSGSGWANPLYRFATSGTQLSLQEVSAGSYQLRLGAFSEVSGRWEYLPAISITVQ